MPEKKMIRADEAQVLLLDKLLEEIRNVKSELGEQKKLIMEQIPEGIVEPLNIVHVTSQQRVITPPMKKNWFSVSVVSDGPDPCWVIVNSEKSTTSPYLLRMNETTEVDMGTAKIVDIVCYCDSGQEASLRIRGVR
jgi:hypothetical protein